jgi:release factor glutamine methyltransferase
MFLSDLIFNGSKQLKKNNITSHLLDSELIISNILKKNREEILISSDQKVSKYQISKFNMFIKRRIKKEPVAYIFKKKEFWKDEFFVNKYTLIPRPETELLVEKIVKSNKKLDPLILDIGTGSGCILISLMKEIKSARGIGIDISKKALLVAKKNAKNILKFKKIKFLNKSINSSFDKKFDLIVSNPPYITTYQLKNLMEDVKTYEPKIALDGGNDGLDVIKKVIYKAKNILKFNGTLALEIGNGQYRKVSQILRINNFREQHLVRDYQNNIRCILTVLKS